MPAPRFVAPGSRDASPNDASAFTPAGRDSCSNGASEAPPLSARMDSRHAGGGLERGQDEAEHVAQREARGADARLEHDRMQQLDASRRRVG